ncbi:hypothetical protein Tco_1177092 [Tanacetum coccineum]
MLNNRLKIPSYKTFRGGIEQCQLKDLMAKLSEFLCSDVPDRWWWDIDTQGHEIECLSYQKSKHIVLEGGVGSHLDEKYAFNARDIFFSDIMCAICGNEIEDNDHVFSSWKVAFCTWCAVFCWLQLSTVSMGTINDTMQWVDSCGMPEKKKNIFEAVSLRTI